MDVRMLNCLPGGWAVVNSYIEVFDTHLSQKQLPHLCDERPEYSLFQGAKLEDAFHVHTRENKSVTFRDRIGISDRNRGFRACHHPRRFN